MIQKTINNILGMAAGATLFKDLKGMAKKSSMEAKYGPGGSVEAGIASSLPGGLSIDESKAIAPDLEEMRKQAATTDLREKQAKTMGLFPTDESKAIRQEGLERKQANIEQIKSKIALQRAQGKINAKAEQNKRKRTSKTKKKKGAK